MQLKDKVAVVTGGASGFGKAIARLYAQEGARVVVADLNGPGADAVAADIGSNARPTSRIVTMLKRWRKPPPTILVASIFW